MKQIVCTHITSILLLALLLSNCSEGEDNGTDDLKIKDADGNSYSTVKIGSQTWLSEDLKTSHYNDSNPIPLVTDNSAWKVLTTSGYCWYDNDEATYKGTYGALYNWYAVETGKLCPKGWHVPTDAEWLTLTTYLGGVDIAGGKLKQEGLSLWESPNTGANNEVGFSALPTGDRTTDGTSEFIGYRGYWWSGTEGTIDGFAWSRRIYYNDNAIGTNQLDKNSGFCVRCIKD